MLRSRFYLNLEGHDDYRPIKFPPPAPYWCSGYDSNMRPCIIAYTETEDQILEYWPEADNIDSDEVDSIQFSSRFPKPDWWNPEESN